jgi:LysR family transcriptional regulator, regulator for metE and metH
MIEIRHLRSLKAIAESGTLASAAGRVHLTQSALSHQIRVVEEHYNITLFQRTAHGLRFTPAGNRLLKLAEIVLEATTQAERDLERLKSDQAGELRIVLECHTCFDWLTPVMDLFRRAWPEVEIDLVAGFHSDPWSLLREGKADFVIGGLPSEQSGKAKPLQHAPLFTFEILAVLPVDHPLQNKPYLKASDFFGQTLITYPVPENRIDLIRHVLAPEHIVFERRTAELTIAIMQLVASRRGLAALPSWGLQNYLEHEYVIAKPIGKKGLWSELYATGTPDTMNRAYAIDLIRIIRASCMEHLQHIKLL